MFHIRHKIRPLMHTCITIELFHVTKQEIYAQRSVASEAKFFVAIGKINVAPGNQFLG